MVNVESPREATVLLVEDDPQEREMLSAMISSLGYQVVSAADGEEALACLGSTPVEVILTDLAMPHMDGLQLLRVLAERGERTPAIVLTAFGNIDQAVSAVRDLCAFWFLEKPAQPAILGPLLERATQHTDLIRETERLNRQLGYRGELDPLVGASSPMQEVYSLIQRVAPTNAPVLITGESGTGKEMVARAIHRLSARGAGPFVAVNCASLPEHLMESELFGHEKGSFTGAVGRHAGCFEQAHGGTLLLDEIAEMPLNMQSKLLRTLEDSRVRRVGGSAEVSVDVRVLAATNRIPEKAAEIKGLREELYYRLNVFRVHLPPLRHRSGDIPALVQTLIADINRKNESRVSDIDPVAMQRLIAHSWPGNVRELRNVLERAVIVAGEGTLRPDHLPRAFAMAPAPAPELPDPALEHALHATVGKTLDEIDKEYILLTLKSLANDKKKAAQILGISIRTLYNRLAEFAAQATSVHGSS